jgi:GTP cyclohydrolase I
MPQASSPLKSELLSEQAESSSTTSSSSPQTTTQSLEHERQFTQSNRQEQQREALELEDFRKLALEKQQFDATTSSSGAAGGSFEPFVGSRVGSPIPDRHGLGWPGKSPLPLSLSFGSNSLISVRFRFRVGKGTLARLNSTEEEKLQRQKKLSDAVKTVLECIGEDPERDGLLKTPERYAKALLWMTKGYEERLPGELLLQFPTR